MGPLGLQLGCGFYSPGKREELGGFNRGGTWPVLGSNKIPLCSCGERTVEDEGGSRETSEEASVTIGWQAMGSEQGPGSGEKGPDVACVWGTEVQRRSNGIY